MVDGRSFQTRGPESVKLCDRYVIVIVIVLVLVLVLGTIR